MLAEDFLDSFLWRKFSSFSERTAEVYEGCSNFGVEALPTLLTLATIPGHPYNARYLSDRLMPLPLPERDELWTIPISRMSSLHNGSLPFRIIDWCFRVPDHLVDDVQAELIGRILIWFCSSNHRKLRNDATYAAIHILRGRAGTMSGLLRDFHSVDDPYVVESAYAIAAGIAMREGRGAKLRGLAETVFESFFSGTHVSPNILVRDYASCVMECALVRKSLPDGIDPKRFRPIFRSEWPEIISDEATAKFSKNEGWRQILSSVEVGSSYGDFGRYTMGSAVQEFSSRLLSEARPTESHKENFSPKIARRWVIQRVADLGWTSARFEAYEDHMPTYGRQRVDVEDSKVERISKKYQWIALRELQGYLTDHYWLEPKWRDGSPDYKGAWQLWGRPFDPSKPLPSDLGKSAVSQSTSLLKLGSIDPLRNSAHVSDRDAWVKANPEGRNCLSRAQRMIRGWNGHLSAAN